MAEKPAASKRVRGLLSPKEFSQLSGLSLATVHRYLKAGKLPFLQPGGPRSRVLIPSDALQLPSPMTSIEREAESHQLFSASQVVHPPSRQPRWMRKVTHLRTEEA